MGKFKRHNVFKSGIHKNTGEQVWPPDRVRGILDATRRFSPALIPYTLLHPENALPIYGFCKKESVELAEVGGDVVLSTVMERFAEEAIPSLIKAGLNQISVGLGKLDEIVHFGFVPKPAVTGLGTVFSEASVALAPPVGISSVLEVSFSAEELGGSVINAFGVSWEWALRDKLDMISQVFRSLRDREIEKSGVDAADKFIPAYLIDSLARPLPQDAQDTTVKEGDMVPSVGFMAGNDNQKIEDMALTELEKTELEQLRGENKLLKSEKEEALNKASELERGKRKAEVTSFVDSISDKVPPSVRDLIEGVLIDLQGVQPRVFSAADGTTAERSSYDVLKELLTAGPVQVIFREVATGESAGESAQAPTLQDALQVQYDAVKRQ